MSTATLPAVTGPSQPPSVVPSLAGGIRAIEAAMDELKAIRTFVKAEMKEGLDFGKIPGTGEKPTLLQPGAQKAAMYFNSYPRHIIQRSELGDGHLEVIVTTHLVNRSSEKVIAEGVGSCSTLEKKYRYRNGERVCPFCGQATIIKGKEEYGGGWICFRKKGGCGEKFHDGDPAIEGQQVGQIPNHDIYDVRNTVLKMAKKRADVDAAMSLGCLSELFTQDLEDTYELPSRVSPWDAGRDEAVPAAAPQDEPTLRRSEVNDQFKPRGANGKKPKEDRHIQLLIQDGVRAMQDKFRAEFPEAPTLQLNTFRIERHLVKHVTGKATDGMKNDDVKKSLFDAYEGAHRKAVVRELVAYLESLYQQARTDYVGEALDAASSGPGPATAPEDEGDPDVDVEQFPDEPGSDG